MEVHRGKASVASVWSSFNWLLDRLSASTFGQTGGDPAKARMQDMARRELQLNNLGGIRSAVQRSQRSQAMMDQVSEDFRES